MQVQKFIATSQARLPACVFDLEAPPVVAGLLILAACDRQMAAIERHEADPSRALLRLQLPTRPDPRSYSDWEWVAVPLRLPPTVPAGAVLHLPTLRVAERVRAEVAHTRPVPAPRREGHETGLGIDWSLNTLLSAGAARLHPDGTITALGAGAQYRASGVLAKADPAAQAGRGPARETRPLRAARSRPGQPSPGGEAGRHRAGGRARRGAAV